MKVIIAAAVLASACGTTSEYTIGTTTVTGSTNLTRETAIDRMTTERCNRELACGNIGPTQPWGDVAACRDEVHEDMSNFLKADTCKAVDYYDLAVCSIAIRNTQCSSTGVPPLAECKGSKICR